LKRKDERVENKDKNIKLYIKSGDKGTEETIKE